MAQCLAQVKNIAASAIPVGEGPAQSDWAGASQCTASAESWPDSVLAACGEVAAWPTCSRRQKTRIGISHNPSDSGALCFYYASQEQQGRGE